MRSVQCWPLEARVCRNEAERTPTRNAGGVSERNGAQTGAEPTLHRLRRQQARRYDEAQNSGRLAVATAVQVELD